MNGLSVTLPLLFLFFFLLWADRQLRRQPPEHEDRDMLDALARMCGYLDEEQRAAEQQLMDAIRDRQRGRR